MKKIILLFLFLSLTFNLYADEVITDFEEQSIPVLNEILRKLRNDFNNAGAPSGATYITQIANSVLTNEQALSSLATGIMKVTTTTGAITSTQIDDWLPSQTGNSGKFLTTNGTNSSWGATSTGTGKQIFTSTGTFTAPTGVSIVFVTMCGGGGGGGGGINGASAGGGGGGANVFRIPVDLTASSNYTVTVGAAGSAGATGADGGAGGASSFAGDSYTVTANGGSGGKYYTGTALGGAGGTASTATAATQGDAGTAGVGGYPGVTIAGADGAAGPGGDNTYGGGGGGTSTFGKGGAGGEAAANGYVGTGYGTGGGGGGGSGTRTGGAGKAGIVMVEW